MPRYFVECAYKGSNYHGWQIQPNALSVQAEINYCISTFLRNEINVTGAGRTDTGVHASFFVFHFDTESHISSAQFVHKLNRFLPKDIVFYRMKEVKDDAHARFDALSRSYAYFIETQKNPFNQEFAYFLTHELEVNKMNEAASLLLKYEDFTSFSKLHTDVKTNNCKIIHAKWKKEGSKLVFEITADRFLRNMVRAIVGTLLEVGLGKMELTDFIEVIESKDRKKAGTSAPAQGLFLTKIVYPDSIYL